MAADDARARYRRGEHIERLGGLSLAVGFVTGIASDDRILMELGAGVALLLAAGLIGAGAYIKGEASVFITAWVKGRDAE